MPETVCTAVAVTQVCVCKNPTRCPRRSVCTVHTVHTHAHRAHTSPPKETLDSYAATPLGGGIYSGWQALTATRLPNALPAHGLKHPGDMPAGRVSVCGSDPVSLRRTSP